MGGLMGVDVIRLCLGTDLHYLILSDRVRAKRVLLAFCFILRNTHLKYNNI